MLAARKFVENKCTADGRCLLRYWRGDFYYWRGTHYRKVDDEEFEGAIRKFLANARTYGPKVGNEFSIVPYLPDTASITNVWKSLVAEVIITASKDAPFSLMDWDGDAGDWIAMKNGLLHIPTLTLSPHGPEFFNVTYIDVEYIPGAQCELWRQFVGQVLPGDQKAVDTLQEIMGYCLTADTWAQKGFALIGVRRSGKGTIIKVLQALLGTTSWTTARLQTFAGQFGLQSCINKNVCFFPDATVKGMRSDAQAGAVENIKTITGEDAINVPRKNERDWIGHLLTKIFIAANDLPDLRDNSGTFATRLIMLHFTQSFYGREDPKLFDKLRAELCGILIWALEGVSRVRKREAFIQPESGQDLIEELTELGSAIMEFARDECEFGVGYEVYKDALYEVWRSWCFRTNHPNVGASSQFARDLFSAYRGRIFRTRPAEGSERVHKFTGIRVRGASGITVEQAQKLAEDAMRNAQN